MAAAMRKRDDRLPPSRPLQYETTASVRFLQLPNPRKGWRGCPYASVQVGEYRPGRWIWAMSVALPSGQGKAMPLGRWSDSPVHDEHATEAAALEAAFQAVLRYLGAVRLSDDKAAGAIRTWAAAQGRIETQTDLFES